MVVNQRAATITGSGSQQWVIDRWSVYNATGTVTFQQSTTAPTGYSNSLLATVTATGSYSTSGYTLIGQFIEGYNTADLAWGTSSAKTVTVSFWVRASVTGTYTVSLQNNGQNRSYVATYTINTANTWEQKSITIAGETSGTWDTGNTAGLRVWFGLGLGTVWDTTANAWQSANYYSTSSAVDFAANSGATFYVTGVQVEQSSVATEFERRPVGLEVDLCYRYFYWFKGSASVYNQITNSGVQTSNAIGRALIITPVPMRTAIGSASLSFSANELVAYNGGAIVGITSIAVQSNSDQYISVDCGLASTITGSSVILTNVGYTSGLTINAEL
jgi:hypothetical protein